MLGSCQSDNLEVCQPLGARADHVGLRYLRNEDLLPFVSSLVLCTAVTIKIMTYFSSTLYLSDPTKTRKDILEGLATILHSCDSYYTAAILNTVSGYLHSRLYPSDVSPSTPDKHCRYEPCGEGRQLHSRRPKGAIVEGQLSRPAGPLGVLQSWYNVLSPRSCGALTRRCVSSRVGHFCLGWLCGTRCSSAPCAVTPA